MRYAAATSVGLGIAITLYVDDYKVYPYVEDANRQMLWYELLSKYYAGQDKLLACPANHDGNRSALFFASGWVYKGPWSYGYNAFGTGGWVTTSSSGVLGLGGVLDYGISPSDYPCTPEANVKMPVDMIAIGDSMLVPGLPRPEFLSLPARPVQDRSARHDGGSNIAFCDGHSESIRNNRLVSNDDASRRRWNNNHEPH